MIDRDQIKRAVRRLVNRKATAKTLRRLSYWRGVDRRLNARKLKRIMRYNWN